MRSNVKTNETICDLEGNLRPETLVDDGWLREQILAAKARFGSALELDDKEAIRQAHITAQQQSDTNRFKTVQRLTRKHSKYLADGNKICPKSISPVLVEACNGGLESDLFRLARSSWSMPYSKGYGRRLRFIIIDETHQTLMGAIGLQSPPADLRCRDELVGETSNKLDWVNTTMDAYTVGAIGPYRELLGGKLAAGVLSTREVQQAYWRKYGSARTIINNSLLSQPLTAVTTASAFGKSSIYNRLKYDGRTIAEPIGYTKGYGSIHLEHLYPFISKWLEQRNMLKKGGFGKGPKIRWQNIQIAARELDLPRGTLLHGLRRQVFLFKHASNFEEVAKGNEKPIPVTFDFDEWANFWKERYCIPRSTRTTKYTELSTLNDILRANTHLNP